MRHLSRLLAEVAAGEEIVIAKAGKPVARIVPVASPRPQRVLGIDKGRSSPRTRSKSLAHEQDLIRLASQGEGIDR